MVIGLDLTMSFFCTERHLGKFCFQIHEFGSDIIDDNEIGFDRLSLRRKVFDKKSPFP